MCPLSRARTTTVQKAHPVVVHGLQRSWTARAQKSGMTAVGVVPTTTTTTKSSSCAGVLMKVSSRELEQFDLREKSYHRIPLKTSQVNPYYVQNDMESTNIPHHYDEYNDETVRLWTYTPMEPLRPSRDFPIAQTYVDVILRGCLFISMDFCRQFLETTSGWQYPDGDNVFPVWVNDRQDPIYGMADYEYSRDFGDELDELLEEYVPEAFARRTTKRRGASSLQ